MNSKIGTELNIALDTPEPLRENSLELNTGYDNEFNSWRLIIKFIGNLSELAMDYNAVYTELLGGFAIILVCEDVVNDFAMDNRVIYIEKPKLFVQQRVSINGFVQSCMSVPYFNRGLRGSGVTVAIIDSGIDIFHEDFSVVTSGNDMVESKIVGLWDQSLSGNPPSGYNMGTYFDNNDINDAINTKQEFDSKDASGHGTAVAGIVTACTPNADLLIVKLATGDNEQVNTANLMMAIDFAVKYSIDNNVPLVINLSYGNNSGDHNGNSVLERYIDTVSLLSRVTFVVGAGNDALAGRHVQINMEYERVFNREFQIPSGEGSINIQVWSNFQDQIDVFLFTPSGEVLGPFNDYEQLVSYSINNMDIRVLNSGPSPINSRQETYISIIPVEDFIESGVWSIRLIPQKIIDGRVDIWLPVEGSTNTNIFFLNPSESTTITIPSTSESVITVGAYDSNNMSYAAFSGRGYTVDGNIKPDVVAPGVNIDAPRVGGGYSLVTGTSFATPFVSAASAMLMEYGIVMKNDPFLYGEKVKAYLISGAKTLPIFKDSPNILLGWGTLCVEDSFS
ncbi:MAG: peptidase S8 [Lachnospiraceae bacterium]|nr:peptidase S8 [Lachnospiraceae bacterium]